MGKRITTAIGLHAILVRIFLVNWAGIGNLCASIASHVTWEAIRVGLKYPTCSYVGFLTPHIRGKYGKFRLLFTWKNIFQPQDGANVLLTHADVRM